MVEMRILLIAPPLFLQRTKKISPRFPPYLLLSTAAQLEAAGFEVNAYDAFLEGADFDDIRKTVRLYNPSVVAIFPADITRFSPIEIDIELVNLLKKFFPGIPIVIAGLESSIIINKLTKEASFDYLLLGDPEEAMLDLVRCIAAGGDVKRIPGLFLRGPAGEFADPGNRRIIVNLDNLSFPAWHLVGLDRYHLFPHRYKSVKAYPVMTTRGCPWNQCVFCKEISIANLPPFRSRSAVNVVSEVESAIKKYGVSEVQFYAGNFNTDIEWLREFRAEIKRRDISFSWLCLSRVDKLTEEAVRIMRETGCWNITFGIESSSDSLLHLINKGVTKERVKAGVKLCKEGGIQATGSFLIGLPGETPRDVTDSVKFAVQIGLDYAQFFIAKWHNYHEDFASEGRFNDEWDYSQFDFQGPVLIPKAYDNLTHLKKIQRKAYFTFYTHPKIILKHLGRTRSFRELKRLFSALSVITRMNLERPYHLA